MAIIGFDTLLVNESSTLTGLSKVFPDGVTELSTGVLNISGAIGESIVKTIYVKTTDGSNLSAIITSLIPTSNVPISVVVNQLTPDTAEVVVTYTPTAIDTTDIKIRVTVGGGSNYVDVSVTLKSLIAPNEFLIPPTLVFEHTLQNSAVILPLDIICSLSTFDPFKLTVALTQVVSTTDYLNFAVDPLNFGYILGGISLAIRFNPSSLGYTSVLCAFSYNGVVIGATVLKGFGIADTSDLGVFGDTQTGTGNDIGAGNATNTATTPNTYATIAPNTPLNSVATYENTSSTSYRIIGAYLVGDYLHEFEITNTSVLVGTLIEPKTILYIPLTYTPKSATYKIPKVGVIAANTSNPADIVNPDQISNTIPDAANTSDPQSTTSTTSNGVIESGVMLLPITPPSEVDQNISTGVALPRVSYVITTVDKLTVSNGQSVTFTITTNLFDGSVLDYSLDGVIPTDTTSPLQGSLTTLNGLASITVALSGAALSPGISYLKFNLIKYPASSKSVKVIDTTLAPVANNYPKVFLSNPRVRPNAESTFTFTNYSDNTSVDIIGSDIANVNPPVTTSHDLSLGALTTSLFSSNVGYVNLEFKFNPSNDIVKLTLRVAPINAPIVVPKYATLEEGATQEFQISNWGSDTFVTFGLGSASNDASCIPATSEFSKTLGVNTIPFVFSPSGATVEVIHTVTPSSTRTVSFNKTNYVLHETATVTFGGYGADTTVINPLIGSYTLADLVNSSVTTSKFTFSDVGTHTFKFLPSGQTCSASIIVASQNTLNTPYPGGNRSKADIRLTFETTTGLISGGSGGGNTFFNGNTNTVSFIPSGSELALTINGSPSLGANFTFSVTIPLGGLSTDAALALFISEWQANTNLINAGLGICSPNLTNSVTIYGDLDTPITFSTSGSAWGGFILTTRATAIALNQAPTSSYVVIPAEEYVFAGDIIEYSVTNPTLVNNVRYEFFLEVVDTTYDWLMLSDYSTPDGLYYRRMLASNTANTFAMNTNGTFYLSWYTAKLFELGGLPPDTTRVVSLYAGSPSNKADAILLNSSVILQSRPITIYSDVTTVAPGGVVNYTMECPDADNVVIHISVPDSTTHWFRNTDSAGTSNNQSILRAAPINGNINFQVLVNSSLPEGESKLITISYGTKKVILDTSVTIQANPVRSYTCTVLADKTTISKNEEVTYTLTSDLDISRTTVAIKEEAFSEAGLSVGAIQPIKQVSTVFSNDLGLSNYTGIVKTYTIKLKSTADIYSGMSKKVSLWLGSRLLDDSVKIISEPPVAQPTLPTVAITTAYPFDQAPHTQREFVLTTTGISDGSRIVVANYGSMSNFDSFDHSCVVHANTATINVTPALAFSNYGVQAYVNGSWVRSPSITMVDTASLSTGLAQISPIPVGSRVYNPPTTVGSVHAVGAAKQFEIHTENVPDYTQLTLVISTNFNNPLCFVIPSKAIVEVIGGLATFTVKVYNLASLNLAGLHYEISYYAEGLWHTTGNITLSDVSGI